MYQIGIVSKKSHLLVQVQALLGKDFELNPHVFLKAEALMDRLEAKNLDGVILSFPMFGPAQKKIVDGALTLYPKLPILVIAETVGPSARRQMKSIGAHVFLKEMGRLDEVPGIMKKLIRNKPICSRNHERFVAQQNASVKTEGGLYAGRVVNLGRGGLMVKTFRSNVETNSLVKVEVPGVIPGSSRVVSGEVVWIQEDLHNHNRTATQVLGIRFIS
jgi:hypothetical protein